MGEFDVFRRDKEIVLTVMQLWSGSPSMIKQVINDLDPTVDFYWDVMMESVKGGSAQYILGQEPFRLNRDVVMAAVRKDGDAFQHVDESFKRDWVYQTIWYVQALDYICRDIADIICINNLTT